MLVLIKDAGIIGIRHLFSSTLHRKWRNWMDTRFNQALLDGNHTHFHVQHGGRNAAGLVMPAPDNIDQRVLDSIKAMTGGAIGLAMGIMSVITALFFVGQKLIETSSEVAGLEFLGPYGSAVLAFCAVAIYVPINTYNGAQARPHSRASQRAHAARRGQLPPRIHDAAAARVPRGRITR